MNAPLRRLQASSRGRWLAGTSVLAVLGCVGAAGTIAAASAGYHGTTKGTGSAAVVDRNDPRAVVVAYMDAMTHGRVDEMRSLVSPHALNPSLNDNVLDRGFGRHDAELTDWVVKPVQSAQGRRGDMFVPVDFTLRRIGHDTGFVDGRTFWGYVLFRTSPERGWLIIDEGLV